MSNAAQLPTSTEQSRLLRGISRVGLVLLGLLLIGAALRLLAHDRAEETLQQRTAEALERSVSTFRATPATGVRTVSLPATLRGYEESVIFARTGGYVLSWRHTLGDRVRKGEVLAQLSAPELEQELLQARAAREEHAAQDELSAATLARWQTQLQSGVVSRQAFEEKRSEHRQAQSNLAAADASVRRLQQLLELQRIVAPFDGVITARGIDVGAHVTPGATQLFAMAQADRLRLNISVPQAYASDVQVGQPVKVTVDELPGRHFEGRVAHVSGGIDSTTRTRQVEVIVPNAEGRLLPGAFARVSLDLKSSVASLLIPPGALLFGKDGAQVIVVDAERRLQFRDISLGRDLGRELEVLEGISAEDDLVLNPSDTLQPGQQVRVAAAAGAASTP